MEYLSQQQRISQLEQQVKYLNQQLRQKDEQLVQSQQMVAALEQKSADFERECENLKSQNAVRDLQANSLLSQEKLKLQQFTQKLQSQLQDFFVFEDPEQIAPKIHALLLQQRTTGSQLREENQRLKTALQDAPTSDQYLNQFELFLLQQLGISVNQIEQLQQSVQIYSQFYLQYDQLVSQLRQPRKQTLKAKIQTRMKAVLFVKRLKQLPRTQRSENGRFNLENVFQTKFVQKQRPTTKIQFLQVMNEALKFRFSAQIQKFCIRFAELYAVQDQLRLQGNVEETKLQLKHVLTENEHLQKVNQELNEAAIKKDIQLREFQLSVPVEQFNQLAFRSQTVDRDNFELKKQLQQLVLANQELKRSNALLENNFEKVNQQFATFKPIQEPIQSQVQQTSIYQINNLEISSNQVQSNQQATQSQSKIESVNGFKFNSSWMSKINQLEIKQEEEEKNQRKVAQLASKYLQSPMYKPGEQKKKDFKQKIWELQM